MVGSEEQVMDPYLELASKRTRQERECAGTSSFAAMLAM